MSELNFASIPLGQPLPYVENGYRLFAGEVLNALIYRLNNGGSVTYPIQVSQGGTGATDAATARTNLGLTIGTNVQAYSALLTALAALSNNGLVVKTAAGTVEGRSLTAPASGLTITNPAGIAGNPTFAFTGNLLALDGLSGTGIAVQTGAGAWAQRTLTAGAGITVTNGSGVAGNPTAAVNLTADFAWTGNHSFSLPVALSVDGLSIGVGDNAAIIYQPANNQFAVAVGPDVSPKILLLTTSGLSFDGSAYLTAAAIGVSVQAYSARLTTIASLTPANGDFLQYTSGAWANRTAAQATATLSVMVGDSGSGGTKGLVPAPISGDASRFLRGDGTWATVSGAGTVTSVQASGGTTGLSFSGGPITGSGTLTLAGTLSAANGGTGLTALATGMPLFFGTPTSANLAATVTDETGTGSLVFATSPVLVTPILGTPASGNLSNTTADGINAVGFRTIPQNSRSTAYTTVLADSGKHIYHPTTDNNARTFTIDSNANVPYPVGTAITFVNDANTLTISITADTLVLSPSGSTGSRTLAAQGVATALKVTATRWIISGSGLT